MRMLFLPGGDLNCFSTFKVWVNGENTYCFDHDSMRMKRFSSSRMLTDRFATAAICWDGYFDLFILMCHWHEAFAWNRNHANVLKSRWASACFRHTFCPTNLEMESEIDKYGMLATSWFWLPYLVTNACYSLKWKILAQNPHQIAAEYIKNDTPTAQCRGTEYFSEPQKSVPFFPFLFLSFKNGVEIRRGTKMCVEPTFVLQCIALGKGRFAFGGDMSFWTDLRFGDDILPFAWRAAKKMALLDDLVRKLQNIGLELNAGKTVVLTSDVRPPSFVLTQFRHTFNHRTSWKQEPEKFTQPFSW